MAGATIDAQESVLVRRLHRVSPQHRSLQPTGTAAPPPGQPVPLGPPGADRFNELLDTVKHAYDESHREVIALKLQRDEYEAKINAQVNELNHIRQSLYELEAAHKAVRLRYEDEFQRLTQELATRPVVPAAALPAPNAPPYPPPAEYEREERERERERDRERDRIAREREREIRDRERERDRERDREREREIRDRERDRDRDVRGAEPAHNGKRAAPASAGPAGSRDKPPASGPPPAHPNKSATAQAQRPQTPQSPMDGTQALQLLRALTRLRRPHRPHHPPTISPDCKKEGGDWFAVFNPKAKRALDVSLTLTLAHESVVCCVRFSHDGKYLATGCNRSAQIYDTKTGAKTCVLIDEAATKTGDLYIRSVCFSPDGKYLATGAEDKQIRIWDIAKKRIQKYFDGHAQEIYSLDFSRDGRLIVSGSGDKTARIWDMETGGCKVLQIVEPDVVDAGVTSVAISPDGRLVAAGSLDMLVRIWDTQSGALIERLRGHQDSVYSVAFTPDGRGLVSGSLDKSLKFWDLRQLLASPRMTQPLSQGGSTPSNAAHWSNGKKEGGEKGSVCTTGFVGHKDYVLSVAVSPDGEWIVSGSKDRGVQFWDPRTAQQQLMLQGHKNSVISIDLSPAGGLLATGSGDWQARVWSYNVLE
ncbi:general transcriptional corepressor tupA [Ceratobasidium sp. AG-Ba]|nr:general transcriptional corepressor tupA [Ceratobasidium sp. AG-Ba]